jgi:hypothetical protein
MDEQKDKNALILMLGIIDKKMESVITLLSEANKNIKALEVHKESTDKK